MSIEKKVKNAKDKKKYDALRNAGFAFDFFQVQLGAAVHVGLQDLRKHVLLRTTALHD